MLTEKEVKVGAAVYYLDNKAKVVNTTISSEVLTYRNEPAVCVISQKDPVQLKYLTKGHKEAVQAPKVSQAVVTIPQEDKAPVIAPKEVKFMAKILDEHKEVEITPELIREKAKDLLSLEINGIFDTEGAEKVKAAKNKAVKMRTAVEKLEKSYLGEIKAAAEAAKKKVTDVSNPIYEACREAENALQLKLDAHNNAIAEAAEKERKEREAKTTERQKKMFELGMLFNGTNYVGYGKTISGLFDLDSERYEELVLELEALKMEADMKGEGVPMYNSAPSMHTGYSHVVEPITETYLYKAGQQKREPITFANAVKETVLPNGTRIILTEGIVEQAEGMQVVNDRILQSKYYLQVI